jgi:SAM-dependent methyltransferase
VGDLDLAGLNEHERRNRFAWNDDAPRWVAAAERNWAPETAPHWGMWHVPEDELAVLPAGGVAGLDAIELGCGTGYWSAWLARAGARPTGIDLSEQQLATARAMQERHGVAFPLIHASAERVPLPDASFDVALSEYGASLWCDPYGWLPEAWRLLRPGGRLVFLTNSVLAALTAPPVDGPVTETLQRPQRGLHRLEWNDDEPPVVEFHLAHSDMMALLRDVGFDDLLLRELYPPPGGDPGELRHYATRGWAQRWPCEEIWTARKPPAAS